MGNRNLTISTKNSHFFKVLVEVVFSLENYKVFQMCPCSIICSLQLQTSLERKYQFWYKYNASGLGKLRFTETIGTFSAFVF
jgi:hypothetical protein